MISKIEYARQIYYNTFFSLIDTRIFETVLLSQYDNLINDILVKYTQLKQTVIR
jgi:hypothetical protein